MDQRGRLLVLPSGEHESANLLPSKNAAAILNSARKRPFQDSTNQAALMKTPLSRNEGTQKKKIQTKEEEIPYDFQLPLDLKCACCADKREPDIELVVPDEIIKILSNTHTPFERENGAQTPRLLPHRTEEQKWSIYGSSPINMTSPSLNPISIPDYEEEDDIFNDSGISKLSDNLTINASFDLDMEDIFIPVDPALDDSAILQW